MSQNTCLGLFLAAQCTCTCFGCPCHCANASLLPETVLQVCPDCPVRALFGALVSGRARSYPASADRTAHHAFQCPFMGATLSRQDFSVHQTRTARPGQNLCKPARDSQEFPQSCWTQYAASEPPRPHPVSVSMLFLRKTSQARKQLPAAGACPGAARPLPGPIWLESFTG